MTLHCLGELSVIMSPYYKEKRDTLKMEEKPPDWGMEAASRRQKRQGNGFSLNFQTGSNQLISSF